MYLYNTLTKKIELFIPNQKNKVKMYTCGPTVYHYAHIGNLRTYIMEDILEKGLKYLGYEVERVMNITDVGHLSSDADTGEDKMLKGAKREQKSVLEIAKYYTDAFFDDCHKLNINIPKTIIPATSCIDEYIKIISRLLETNYAYINGGNIYFDTSKLENYYALTNNKEEGLMKAVRDEVSEDSNKRNQTDFVLWFTKSKFDDQELKWNSPWGLGYPGWHIECSGISLKYLGEYLDIHCGGIDNIFPHHTNEIAQSESYIGHKWCNYWFHSEFLNDNTGKMSKSKGEFLTLTLLESKGYIPMIYRFYTLQSHYRKTLLFSYDNLDIVKNTYLKLKNKIKMINTDINLNEEIEDASKYRQSFKEALENDLNTSMCLTTLYDVIKSDLNNTTKIELIKEFDTVLALDLLKEEKKEIDEKYILEAIQKRNLAKEKHDYKEADSIRDMLLQQGITLKDTREGTTYDIL